MPQLGVVVEGPGDRDAVKILLTRLLNEEYKRADWRVATPKQAGGSGNLLREGGLERFVQLAYNDGPTDAVLVLLDGDVVGSNLHQLEARLRTLGLPIHVRIALAQPMYESWLIASFETTGPLLPGRLTKPQSPTNIEAIISPSEWINQKVRQSNPKQAYSKTRDQAEMTRGLDFDLVHNRSESFRNFLQTLEQLLTAANPTNPIP